MVLLTIVVCKSTSKYGNGSPALKPSFCRSCRIHSSDVTNRAPASVEITSLPEMSIVTPVRLGFDRYTTRQYPLRRHSARYQACSPASGDRLMNRTLGGVSW